MILQVPIQNHTSGDSWMYPYQGYKPYIVGIYGLSSRIPRKHNKYHGYRATPVLVPWIALYNPYTPQKKPIVGTWWYKFRASSHNMTHMFQVPPGNPYKKRMRRAMVLSRAAAMSGERTMMVKRKGSTT